MAHKEDGIKMNEISRRNKLELDEGKKLLRTNQRTGVGIMTLKGSDARTPNKIV